VANPHSDFFAVMLKLPEILVALNLGQEEAT
jgi:hypothetical protein